MEDQELRQRLEALEKRIEAIYASIEKARKYLLVLVFITVVALVVPLIGIAFELPALLSNYAAIESL